MLEIVSADRGPPIRRRARGGDRGARVGRSRPAWSSRACRRSGSSGSGGRSRTRPPRLHEPFRLVRAAATPAQVEQLARAAAIAESAAFGVVAGAAEGAAPASSRTTSAPGAQGADLDHFSISYDGLGSRPRRAAPARPGALLRLGLHPRRLVLTRGRRWCGDPGPEALTEQAATRRGCRRGGDATWRLRLDRRGDAAAADRGITACFPRSRLDRGARLPRADAGLRRRSATTASRSALTRCSSRTWS